MDQRMEETKSRGLRIRRVDSHEDMMEEGGRKTASGSLVDPLSTSAEEKEWWQSETPLSVENAGARLFTRSERETFIRFPR